jgi:hypothetical protein
MVQIVVVPLAYVIALGALDRQIAERSKRVSLAWNGDDRDVVRVEFANVVSEEGVLVVAVAHDHESAIAVRLSQETSDAALREEQTGPRDHDARDSWLEHGGSPADPFTRQRFRG